MGQAKLSDSLAVVGELAVREERRDRSAVSQSGTHRRLLVRPILEHPHPLLSRPSVEIDPRKPTVVALANLLVTTMRASAGCVGLAAPQIGENVRIFAMNVTGHKKARSCAGLVVLANPKILSRSGNVVMREGCASVPHLTGDVARAAEVIVSGIVPGSGKNIVITADGIEARCIQHEIDHLDGVLFPERVLDPVAELFVRKRYA
jgi:peptide deformylase